MPKERSACPASTGDDESTETRPPLLVFNATVQWTADGTAEDSFLRANGGGKVEGVCGIGTPESEASTPTLIQR